MKFFGEEFAVVANKGASAYEPENTLPAIERAIELGADAVKVDVRKTKDGVLVTFQDEDLKRLFNVDVKLEDITYEELINYKVCGQTKVPKFDEIMDLVKGKVKLVVDVEVKEIINQIAEALKNKGLLNDTMIVSRDMETILRFKEISKDVVAGLIITHPYPHIVSLRRHGIEYLLPRFNLVRGRMVKEAHAKGLGIIAWVVNDVSIAARLRGLGIDAIITDKPDIKRELEKLHIY
jgi:glycerophosphoryl diester phosphodiesterase